MSKLEERPTQEDLLPSSEVWLFKRVIISFQNICSIKFLDRSWGKNTFGIWEKNFLNAALKKELITCIPDNSKQTELFCKELAYFSLQCLLHLIYLGEFNPLAFHSQVYYHA